jgi:hypothetical protein
VFVQIVQQHLHPDVIKQYQQEESAQIIRRIKAQRQRLRDLRVAASDDPLSTTEKIRQLATELGEYHHNPAEFNQCNTMPQLMYQHLKELLLMEHKKR